MRGYLLLVWTVGVVHILWAVCLFVEPAAANITAVKAIADTIGVAATAWVFLAVGVLAMASRSIASQCHRPGLAELTLLLPQQALLIFSALAAIECVSQGAYADGVPRPRWFIAADQCPGIFLCVAHALAIALLFDPGPRVAPPALVMPNSNA